MEGNRQAAARQATQVLYEYAEALKRSNIQLARRIRAANPDLARRLG